MTAPTKYSPGVAEAFGGYTGGVLGAASGMSEAATEESGANRTRGSPAPHTFHTLARGLPEVGELVVRRQNHQRQRQRPVEGSQGEPLLPPALQGEVIYPAALTGLSASRYTRQRTDDALLSRARGTFQANRRRKHAFVPHVARNFHT